MRLEATQMTTNPDKEQIDLTDVDRIIASIGTRQQDLIPILNALQSHFNYLPEPALRRIPEKTTISAASVAGVATFYAQFRHRPAGLHTVKVCIGTACHVKGAEGIYDAFRKHLGIPDAEDTDKDKLFTVEKVACLGCCMLAPAVQIDDITYGFVEPGNVGNLLTDFLEAQQQTRQDAEAGQHANTDSGEVRICLCSSCVAGGSLKTHTALTDTIRQYGLPVRLKTVGCSGLSFQTPLIEFIMADGRQFQYGLVTPDAVESILLRHFKPTSLSVNTRVAINRLLDRLIPEVGPPVTRYAVDLRSGPNACYTRSQKRLVTESAGEMNPSSLADYREKGGFHALEQSLKTQSPQTIIDSILASGLRGRGGAGFPTGQKWQHVRDAKDSVRYLICNGDEGDPGAFMDRMILESFPFRVIEGMMIAAYAIGAHEGYLYIRNEYPLAAQRLRDAINQCEAEGLLGERTQSSELPLTLSVVEGAGAFVCGEESALIQAIEGNRGMPRFRPPYPAEIGLFGKPTLVNNVETFGMIPWIINNGADAFAQLGTQNSKGTKAFALAGKVARGGLIEVPMGMPLRQIVDEIGGGVPDGKLLKAVQVGGPSGGCVPASLADAPVDYEALTKAGAIMGSGGMVVLDQDDCMVAIARYFLDFTQRESCGKCTFCRVGTKRMLEILDRLCAGKAKPNDLTELEHLAKVTQEGSLCGLGRTAPNPVLSTMMHFRDEYEAHLEGRCPALQCKELIRYRITDNCIGCTRCAQACGVDAIQSVPHEQHRIDSELCVRCDACRQACPVEGAIEVETGAEAEVIERLSKKYENG
jgi:NADH-quinone oxidoreductase subunit F